MNDLNLEPQSAQQITSKHPNLCTVFSPISLLLFIDVTLTI